MAHEHKQIFLIIFILSILVTAMVSFRTFVLKDDYLVYLETECNPELLSCFTREDENGENFYYLKLYKKAYLLQECTALEDELEKYMCQFGCDENEDGICWFEDCDLEQLEDGEDCS